MGSKSLLLLPLLLLLLLLPLLLVLSWQHLSAHSRPLQRDYKLQALAVVQHVQHHAVIDGLLERVRVAWPEQQALLTVLTSRWPASAITK